MNCNTASFVRKVMTHYEKFGRHALPWRKTRDPYRILVSEVMLQQTQVARVIPFYRAFLKKFPSVRALANASLTDVLRLWSGLGYNRRAKFLHEAAITVCEWHNGNVPREYESLHALPGIGEYTAKAVRVFAFDEPEVMLETNIRTALIHEFFPRGRKVSDERLESILDESLQYIESPRVWYAALMDYGAHIKQAHGNATRRSRMYTRQAKFEGSLRQVRGAILRRVVGGDSFNAVRFAQKSGFSLVKTKIALEALKREGLLSSVFK